MPNGSVDSAYDSSRPGSHARDDQVPIIIAVSLTTVPTSWATAHLSVDCILVQLEG